MNYQELVEVLTYVERDELMVLLSLKQIAKHPLSYCSKKCSETSGSAITRYTDRLEQSDLIELKTPFLGIFGATKYVVTYEGNRLLDKYYQDTRSIQNEIYNGVQELKEVFKLIKVDKDKVQKEVKKVIQKAISKSGYSVPRFFIQKMIIEGLFDSIFLNTIRNSDEQYISDMLYRATVTKGDFYLSRLYYYEDNFSGELTDFWFYMMYTDLLYDGYYDEYFIDGIFDEEELSNYNDGSEENYTYIEIDPSQDISDTLVDTDKDYGASFYGTDSSQDSSSSDD